MMGGKKKYIEMFGSFTEPFTWFMFIKYFYWILWCSIGSLLQCHCVHFVTCLPRL